MRSIDSSEHKLIERSRPPLIVIVGPTGVGKTELSLQLAGRLNSEIISADSRLLYRGMDIGTAKPTRQEQERIPHHLIDVAEPDEIWSLAQFQSNAHKAITQVHQRGSLPFLVGGTGQYIHAITQGWKIPQVEPNVQLRCTLEKWAAEVTPEGLHKRLAAIDPRAAGAIDPRNVRRTVRALEVILTTGKLFSMQREQGESRYRIIQIGLTRPRSELYARIDQRLDKMLQDGFIDEVNCLLSKGYSPNLPTMSAIGYSEIAMLLQGQISLEEAITQIRRRTRIFVRRQANWFKLNDPNIHWFQYDTQMSDTVEHTIQDWLQIDSIAHPNIMAHV